MVYTGSAFGVGALRHIDLMKNPFPVTVIRYKSYGVVKAELLTYCALLTCLLKDQRGGGHQITV